MAMTRSDILSEMARELGMRRQLFPKWVKQGKLSADDAKQRIMAMQAAYDFVMETMPLDYVSRFNT